MMETSKPKKFVPFSHRYPSLIKSELPTSYKLYPILYRNKEIEQYDIFFIHRLLSINYGSPADFDWKPIKIREEEGIIQAAGTEWRYYFKTPSGLVIQIETKSNHNFLEISALISEKREKFNKKNENEIEIFINDLLAELQRLEKSLIREDKIFSDEINAYIYLVDNVYLHNYACAETMFDNSKTFEKQFLVQLLKKDFREKRIAENPENIKHFNMHLLVKGMFFASAISYYFMALEGFINLIYYGLLKPEYQIRNTNFDQRLDIELKLLLIPSLCNGFNDKLQDAISEIIGSFRQLKKFRNKFFHAGLSEHLNRYLINEGGFVYNFDMGKYKSSFLPQRKYELREEDVLKVKTIVDSIIDKILDNVDDEYEENVQKYIMSDITVPFVKDSSGKVRLPKPNERLGVEIG